MKPTAILLTVILLVTITLFIGGSFITENKVEAAIPDCTVLAEIPLKEEETAPLPPSVNKQDTTPTAARSELVKPYITKIEKEGYRTENVVAPSPEEVENETDSNEIIAGKVEIEAEYPGGAAAWQRFLNKNLRFPIDSMENEIQGSILVQFVVDEEGNVSDVKALRGSKALGDEVVRVIKKSGKWIPAVQNGRYVKSYKKQPFIICFREG